MDGNKFHTSFLFLRERRSIRQLRVKTETATAVKTTHYWSVVNKTRLQYDTVLLVLSTIERYESPGETYLGPPFFF